MDKIKITFFLQNLEMGGAERSTIRLANALDKSFFEITFLLSCAKGPLLKDLSNEIKVVDLKSPRISLSLVKVVTYLRKEKPEIIFSVLDHVNVISILASIFCKLKPKIVITERSTFSRVSTHSATKLRNRLISRFIMPILAKLLYKKADSIICVSRGVAEDISNVVGNLSSIDVIYNPVISNDLLGVIDEKIENLEVFDKSLPVVIAVGRLTKAKDYYTMLKAFSIVLNSVPSRLLIIGEGDERSKIENIIKELGINKNVFLLGFQKNPLKYMVKADVFVLSSILEGFPNVLVEAMACGVPVVSTDCQSGPSEIIEDGKNGFLVPVGDVKALSGAIIELLKNEKLRAKFSEEGRVRAQYFSAEKSVDKFGKVFLKLLNR